MQMKRWLPTLLALLIVSTAALAIRDQSGSVKIQSFIASAEFSASATSAEIDLADYCLVGIQWGTVTGTSVTATCSTVANGTFVGLNGSDDVAWSVAITDDKFMDLTQGAEAICGCRFLKLVSSSSETLSVPLVLAR